MQHSSHALAPAMAARHICATGDWRVSNLALQKILYLAQMVYLGRMNGQRLIGGSFEAWDYGPVQPELYHRLRAFGTKPIPDIFFEAQALGPGDRRDTLDEACERLLKRSPGELVRDTHWEHGAWAKNYVPGVRGIIIPDQDIVEEYRKRVGDTDNRRVA